MVIMLDIGDIIVESLEDLGVNNVFGIPGTHIYHVFRSIEERGTIKAVVNRHEMASTFMAEAYSRASGKPGVAIVTAGPGATNALTGIGQAFTTSSPVLLISGDVPLGERYDFHGLDEANILPWISYPLTKFSYVVDDPKQVEEYVKKGLICTKVGRMGPVHISIPRDVLGSKVSYKGIQIEDFQKYFVKIPDTTIERFLKGKIAIVLGDEAWYLDTIDKIAQLIRDLKSPFITSMVSLGSLPQTSPYFAGYYEKRFAIAKSARYVLEEADTLLLIGVRPDSVDSESLIKYAKSAETVIHILPSLYVRGELDEILYENESRIEYSEKSGKTIVNIYSPRYEIIDILIEQGLESKPFNTDYRDMINEFKEKIIEEVLTNSNRKPIHMGYAIYMISKYLPGEAIVTTDVGGNESWARDIIGLMNNVRYLYASGFGSLGYSFAAALGAKVATPNKEVISITGDGSLLMSLMELNTMSYHDIKAKIFVINDSSYGILGYLSKRDFDKEIETYIGYVNFAKIAEAMGIDSIQVNNSDKLEDAVRDAVKSNKPILVDIISHKDDIPPLWR